MTKGPYNPLEKLNLARSIESAVLSSEAIPLGESEGVTGAGVYVIYYRGGFEPYRPMADANAATWAAPIYVGKAIPKGGRKGGMTFGPTPGGGVIVARLRKHAESIKATANLAIEDFACRHIALDDIWIPLGENILIERFRPLWNVAVEGFGINDPGRGRLNQKRSAWDVLHPGRSYAARLTGGAAQVEAIKGRVEDHFAGRALRQLPRSVATGARQANEG